MIQDHIHEQIVKHCTQVSDWFEKKSQDLKFPVYASFDVRDSGAKVAPVDANIFPAGFNNICPTDKEHAPERMKAYLDQHYSHLGKRVVLLAEEHTQNAYYWENISSIRAILAASGREVFVALPRELRAPITVKSSSGLELQVHAAENRNGDIYIDGQKMDLIICNNDFSESYESWSRGLKTAMNPPHELGWYRRRKRSFFQQYNDLAREFAEIIAIDPQHLQVETEVFVDFDADDHDSLDRLATKVDEFLAGLQAKYKKQSIDTAPFCFLKNNSGTYGLAVMQVHSGQEIREWNNKTRKKMKASKGGRDVSELIIQEGIPTRFRDEAGGSAEPCIYMIGDKLVGGFLRTHSAKGPEESLNSPGAVYKRLCMSDLEVDMGGCPMENVYGWISKLSALALALEAKAEGVDFRGYVH